MADQTPELDRRPASIDAADTPGLHGLLFVVVVVAVVAGLYVARSVLIPITLAMLLSFLLAPLVNVLRRLYLGRVPSVLLAVIVALTVILALGGLIGTQLATLVEEVPRYAGTVQRKIDTLQSFMQSRVARLEFGFGSREGLKDGAEDSGPEGAGAAAPKHQDDAPKPVPVEVHQPDPSAMELARRILSPVVEPLSTTAIVLVVSIFILLQREDLRDRMIRLFGSADLHRTTLAMNDAARRLSRYLLSQLAVNTGFGILVALGLAFIGIPSPVMWGVLGALLRFMPYVGAPLAALLPLTLAAAIDPGWTLLLWTVGLYAVLELAIGQIVEPLLYGHSTGLSPFSVVVSATFWTWLWGPIGLILSTPLTLCLVVLGRHVARLEFLEVLLGDRPALTPVEGFYQRMLAGDPDEARDQAEILLKDMPLAAYYDSVAVPGLRLAAIDAARGALTPAHLGRVRIAVQTLVEDLEDFEDPDAPAEQRVAAEPQGEPRGEPQGEPRGEPRGGRGPAAISESETVRTGEQRLTAERESGAAAERVERLILSVAGRGPLDQEAAAMLCQLLTRHGLESRVVPYVSTARAATSLRDFANVAAVCVSCLELRDHPSHVKYLVRRLRARLPRGVPIIIGVWPESESTPEDQRLRAALGADHHAATLAEAVRLCLGGPVETASPDAVPAAA